MLVKVFVLGRPGSGKTTVVRHILACAKDMSISTLRMKDYDILYDMFIEECRSKLKNFRPTAYGGFDVLNYSVFDTALEKLEEKIMQECSKTVETPKIITIEFARNDYRAALKKFSSEFLQDSYFFFIDADVQTCIERIRKRVTNPPIADHHFVSDYIMNAYYNKDNWDFMDYEFQEEWAIKKKVVAYKNTGEFPKLTEKIENFIEIILREFGLIPV
jgi:adenylate kinase family enzyme